MKLLDEVRRLVQISRMSALFRFVLFFAVLLTLQASVLLSSASSMASTAKPLTLFWWNVGAGNFGDPDTEQNWHPCYGTHAEVFKKMETQLIKLASQSNAPDVMAFAEYTEKFFSPALRQFMSVHYPFQNIYPYNSIANKIKVAVFSKYPIQQERYIKEGLHWANDLSTESVNNALNSIYLRSYQRLSIEVNGVVFNLVPVHVVDPWPEMLRSKGFLKTVWNLLYSKLTPLAVQGTYYQNILKQEQDWSNPNSVWINFGDYNVPNQYFSVVPEGYKVFKGTLKEVKFQGEQQSTFPSTRCGGYLTKPSIRIDHAFVKGNIQTATGEILPFEGSDHYPILIKISP